MKAEYSGGLSPAAPMQNSLVLWAALLRGHRKPVRFRLRCLALRAHEVGFQRVERMERFKQVFGRRLLQRHLHLAPPILPRS